MLAPDKNRTAIYVYTQSNASVGVTYWNSNWRERILYSTTAEQYQYSEWPSRSMDGKRQSSHRYTFPPNDVAKLASSELNGIIPFDSGENIRPKDSSRTGGVVDP